MPYKDPEKRKAAQRKANKRYYKLNKKRYILNAKRRQRKLVEWLRDYKRNLSCEYCDMSFRERPECCDFHHPDPATKEKPVSGMVRYGWAKKRIMEEIERCIPLCANCHRTVHKVQQ